MPVPFISEKYGAELRRLFYFSYFILPFLSAFSLLTGWYFVRNTILQNALPDLTATWLSVLALVLVSFIELVKYFVSPLVSKSYWYRDYGMTFIMGLVSLVLFGTSIYFSVHGVQAYYEDKDQSEEKIATYFQAQIDSTVQAFNSSLAEKDQAIANLEGSMKEDDFLERVDKLNGRIYKATEGLRKARNDSIAQIYKTRLRGLESERRLLEGKSGMSNLQLEKMNILLGERRDIAQEKEDKVKEIRTAWQTAKGDNQIETSFIQANILYLSLGVELLILISLNFIQYYRLQLSDGERASETVGKSDDTTPSLNGTGHSKTEELLHRANPTQNGASQKGTKQEKKKRLSKEDKQAIILRFQEHEGNVEELVRQLMKEYGIGRSTAFRYKKLADEEK
ncbi:MAG: hypothetical protein AAF655_26110 [Bacteroidota bacterium]